MSESTIRLPSWHEGQNYVYKTRKRYSFLASHRGWRKTSMCVRMAIEWLLTGRDMAWWSPTHKHIMNSWVDFKRVLGQGDNSDWFNKSDHTLTLKLEGRPLGTCYFFSLEVPDNARGWTLPGIGDEMGMWDKDVFDGIVKKVVQKYGPDTWFFGNGTPNPSDPFNDFYKHLTSAKHFPESRASWVIPLFGADVINGELTPNLHPMAKYANLDSPFANFQEALEDYEIDRHNGKGTTWEIEYLCKFQSDSGGQFTGVNLACDISPVTQGNGKYFHFLVR